MAVIERSASTERRRIEGTLVLPQSVHPHVEKILAGLPIDKCNLAELQSFAKACWSDRNRWDVSRRGVGMFGSMGRLTRQDADREFRRQFANLDCGGHHA